MNQALVTDAKLNGNFADELDKMMLDDYNQTES